MEITGLQPLFPSVDTGGKPILLAGPCSAESERQTLETAEALASAGVRIFRAGVWKPRTKPGGFEGIGSPALRWLKAVKRTTGMLVATEVANARHVREAMGAGVDVLWIGARTCANPFAVQEVADALREYPKDRLAQIAVLVKNPVNPDLELWIGGLERIYAAGIRRLGAVHRGFSAYGEHIYRNEPEWRIPIEFRRRLPNVPLLCDPSHIGGRRELVAPLAQQAMDLGFDGLIVESHCHPEMALSDSAQQVTPAELAAIMEQLEHRTTPQPTEDLNELRRTIDRLDDELLEILARRMETARRIGLYKLENSMPVVQPGRYNDLMQKRVADGVGLGLSAEFVKEILASVHQESVRCQLDITSPAPTEQ